MSVYPLRQMRYSIPLLGLRAGFSSSELEIREGESAVASFSIISPAVVDVSLMGHVAHTTQKKTTTVGEKYSHKL